MYEVNFPKFDINANSVDNVPRTAATREKSARDRTKLRRSKSTHCMDKMDIKMRPKSHRFRREKEFYNCYNEVKIIDMEDDNCSNNFSAWCVSFDSEAHRVSCVFSDQLQTEQTQQKIEDAIRTHFQLIYDLPLFKQQLLLT